MKETKIKLILGSHAHVPAGACDSEFERVYENRMRPFITNLYRYSKIQAVLHYSGVLLNWVERNHPEFIMLIEDMVSRKQAEILGGGFYEPSFPLISQQDRISQIEFMTTYLRKHFGKRPQGCLIPAMAWEQNFISSLCASDMNFTFLSQDQFIKAGASEDQIFSPCITEDQGKLIAVFPVSLSIERELKEKSFSQVFIKLKKNFDEDASLSKQNSNPALNDADDFYSKNKIVCIFPEEISMSPREAQDSAWNRFFEEISLSEEIADTVLPSKILKSRKILRKRSFPDSSALAGNVSSRQFLIDNAGANSLYSKMIFTNVLINQLKGDKIRKLNAREELWKAQDSYFFTKGNSYHRGELRKAAYSSLIRAEKLTREKGKFAPSYIQYDFDFDGITEYLFQDAVINYYVSLKGAGIFELDYLPKDWNYLDCGLCGSSRASFSDILLPSGAVFDTTDDFPAETSRLCYNEFYEPVTQDKKGKSCFKLPAVSGGVPFGSIEIVKCYSLKKDLLTVLYTLKNTGIAQEFIFIPEIIFSFTGNNCESSGIDEYARFYTSDEQGKDIQLDKSTGVNNIKIIDVQNEAQILITSSASFSCRLVPVIDSGFYQATRVLPAFKLSLKSDETWSNSFSLKFSH